jgi:hypothetical protein
MKNPKVSIFLGTIIFAVIAITAGAFVRLVEKKQEVAVQPQQVTIEAKTDEIAINKGWKKYISGNKLFSIEYPSDWKIENAVFYDMNGKKIAEFSPGYMDFKPNQKCFDNVQKDSDRTKIISQTTIKINGQQGMLMIERTIKDSEGGIWFPNTYCIKKENKAFIMTFYDYNLNSSKKELFNKIITTLEFKD